MMIYFLFLGELSLVELINNEIISDIKQLYRISVSLFRSSQLINSIQFNNSIDVEKFVIIQLSSFDSANAVKSRILLNIDSFKPILSC